MAKADPLDNPEDVRFAAAVLLAAGLGDLTSEIRRLRRAIEENTEQLRERRGTWLDALRR